MVSIALVRSDSAPLTLTASIGKSSTRDTIIKDVVLGATTIITIGAMWYIYHKMNQAKPHVIYDRRKARYASCLLMIILAD